MKCRDLMNTDQELISTVATSTAEIGTCSEDDDVRRAANEMRESGTSRLLVVGADGGVVGVLSLAEIPPEEGGGESPDEIVLTPSTPEDEDAVAHQSSVMTGANRVDSMKVFPT